MLNVKQMLLLVSVLLMSVSFTGAMARVEELPVQEARIWAPVGDEVGLDSDDLVRNLTLWATSWDPHGSQNKYAEDWQQDDDPMFGGLFAFRKVFENTCYLLVRGVGETGRGALAGRVTLATGRPGDGAVTMDLRNFTHTYDATSEMRARVYSLPPPPPAMDPIAQMDWNHSRVTCRHNLPRGWAGELGFKQMGRKGDKSSLLGGTPGLGVPTRKTFDTTTNEFSGALTYQGAKLGLKVAGSLRKTDGDRTVGEHEYADDQTLLRAMVEGRYEVRPGTSILAHGSTSKLEIDNAEIFNGSAYSPGGEARTTVGRLGFITMLGKSTVGSMSLGLRKQDTDHQTDLAGALEAHTDRKRTGMDLGATVTNSGFAKGRLKVDYKLRTNDLEETIDHDEEAQGIDFKKIDHKLRLKYQRRFSNKTSLITCLGYRSQNIDQTHDFTSQAASFYTMGDRKIRNLDARLKLKMRPNSKVRLNVGITRHNRNFQRDDMDNVETITQNTLGFVGMTVWASETVTFLGNFSYGKDSQKLTDGPVSETGMAPLTYEGRTWRFAPGVLIQMTEKLHLEAQYEGIRFEDPGDQADDVHALNSDLDRMLLRCGYQLPKDLRVTASYRRHEFDENRWDDYIMDLYTLAFSGSF